MILPISNAASVEVKRVDISEVTHGWRHSGWDGKHGDIGPEKSGLLTKSGLLWKELFWLARSLSNICSIWTIRKKAHGEKKYTVAYSAHWLSVNLNHNKEENLSLEAAWYH